jgi:hypothetical protein
MKRIPAMVSMRRTPAEKAEEKAAINDGPEYPWGLCISLCQDELDKLGLAGEVKVGDMLHLHCMAKVTSVSESDSEMSGPSCRVELQITDMVGEDEDSENAEAESTPAPERRRRLYG